MKVLSILFALLFSNFAQAHQLNKLVIFGDSLSDNGNLYELMQHMLPPSPPYYKGRFTNGLVWIEVLAESYYPGLRSEHLLNYAFGGAAVVDEENTVALSLKLEIDMYLSVHQNKADENSLYVIWIGANNYVILPDDVENTLVKVNVGIKRGVQTLIKAGAKHIMLVNLPNLGASPMPDEVLIRDLPPAVIREKLSFYTQQHNQMLINAVDEFKKQNPDVQFVLFDVYSEINKVIYESKIFSNVTQSCYAAHIEKPTNNPSLTIASSIKLIEKSEQDPCDGYLFFDALHPTALAHRLIAHTAQDFLSDNELHFIG